MKQICFLLLINTLYTIHFIISTILSHTVYHFDTFKLAPYLIATQIASDHTIEANFYFLLFALTCLIVSSRFEPSSRDAERQIAQMECYPEETIAIPMIQRI